MTERITEAALLELVTTALARNGFSEANAAAIAEVIVAAERDGTKSHGLFRLPGYISEAGCGWVNGHAVPQVSQTAPGALVADGGKGYCQPAFNAAREQLATLARAQGVAVLAIRNAHHLAALWPEVEWLAERGFIAFAFRNARALVLPHGGRTKMFGTNPIAFACPAGEGPPLVWDFATSRMARGEIMLAARQGHAVPEGTGVDAAGAPTTDPRAILEGGAQLPFGGYKGSLVALMVEIMAAAATGSPLSLEDRSAEVKGAQTADGGELILAIDPGASAGEGFFARMALLLGALRDNGSARVPGERRHRARAEASADGISVEAEAMTRLREWAGAAGRT